MALQVRSPLTVAGAVTGLAADAYTSPYSLFTRPRVVWPGTILTNIRPIALPVKPASDMRPRWRDPERQRRICAPITNAISVITAVTPPISQKNPTSPIPAINGATASGEKMPPTRPAAMIVGGTRMSSPIF